MPGPIQYRTLQQLEVYKFQVCQEAVVHSRYISLYDRTVQFPIVQKLDGKGAKEEFHQFDIVGHPQSNFQFSVVCPVRIKYEDNVEPTMLFTLVYEYCQGLNQQMFCLPTGGFNPSRHQNLEECAVAELSEEVGLKGGQLVKLVQDDHQGFGEVKWCQNRFVPYLVINPSIDENPGERDEEESLMQVVEVDKMELQQLMISGDMMLPSVTTCFLALEYLRKNIKDTITRELRTKEQQFSSQPTFLQKDL